MDRSPARTDAAVAMQLTDLSAKASEQLGSENAAVRVSALTKLERLARAHPDLRQTVVDRICRYLRAPSATTGRYFTLAEPLTAEETALRHRIELDIRRTAQEILQTHLHWPKSMTEPPEQFWEAINLNLDAAVLINLDLSKCRTERADFRNAQFINALFSGASFSSDASFDGASFAGDAEFDGAAFSSNAGFARATFAGDARFDGAAFSNVAMTARQDTKFLFNRSAVFAGATFSGDARFDGATFFGHARFDGAAFSSNAGFARATFAGDACFTGATFARFEAGMHLEDVRIANPVMAQSWPHPWRAEPDLNASDGSGLLVRDL